MRPSRPFDGNRPEDVIARRYEQLRYDCLHVAVGILKDQALAEDAVHDAFVAVMERGEKYAALSVCRDFDEELGRIPPREKLEEVYSFSERHEERMRALFSPTGEKQSRRGIGAKAALRRVKTAAAVLSTAVAACFCVLLASPQVRAAVADTVANWGGAVAALLSGKPGQSPDAGDVWRAQYVPEGFALKETSSDKGAARVVYKNGEGKEIVLSWEKSVDFEPQASSVVVYSKAVVDGVEYLQFGPTGENPENAIVWRRDGYLFKLSSSGVSLGELQAVAMSVGK